MPLLSSSLLESVLRASRRSSSSVHEDIGKRVNSLATIASTAPLVGLLGTTYGIVTSFRSCGGEKSFCMAALTQSLSESIWPTALGLLIGIVSLWFYRYLIGGLQLIDNEMETASLGLVDNLRRLRGPIAFEADAGRADNPLMFGEERVELLRKDLKFWRRSTAFTGTALTASWLVNIERYFYDYSLSLIYVGLAAYLCRFHVRLVVLPGISTLDRPFATQAGRAGCDQRSILRLVECRQNPLG